MERMVEIRIIEAPPGDPEAHSMGPASGRSFRLAGLVAAGLIALSTAGLCLGLLAVPQAHRGVGSATARHAVFEPATAVGEAPFLPPAAAPAQGPGFVEAGQRSGGIGLYGGTLEQECDPALLAKFLAVNPAEGEAWASVQGIPRHEIKAFLTELEPAVVDEPITVTNHGFTQGRATPRLAVLETGTAVLVDARGMPRVRCLCGNPLLIGPIVDPTTTTTTTTTTSTTTTSTTTTSTTTTSTTTTTTTIPWYPPVTTVPECPPEECQG